MFTAMSTHRGTELDAIVYVLADILQERIRRSFYIALLAIVGVPSLTTAQHPPIPASPRVEAVALQTLVRDSLRANIRRMVDSAGLPSLTVGLSVGGRIVWAEGFGYADVAKRVPATPDTRYSLASISKPITATAIMRLVDGGRVQLSAPVNSYLRRGKITGLAGSADSATVARVMSHTAGLPLHYRFYYAGADGSPDVPSTIDRYGLVVYPPGTVYNYSNLGYGILDEIVAATSGMSYESYLHQHVFAPLGMTRTTVSTGVELTNSALRYDAAKRLIPPYDFDHRGASAIYSSANDLLRFAAFHMGTGRDVPANFLADSSIRRMQQVATPPVTAAGGYGLGWAISDDNGVRRVSHTGGMPGVNTVLAFYPDAGVAVVALANQSSPLPGRVASDLAAAVMPTFASVRAARRAEAAARARADAPPGTAPANFVAPAVARGTWRGTLRMYDRSIPLVLWIGESDIRVRLGERPALWTLVNDATFVNGLIGGRFVGTIPTDDARRAPHVVAMSLRLHDGALRGWMAAQVNVPTNDFSLSSFADLARDSTSTVP